MNARDRVNRGRHAPRSPPAGQPVTEYGAAMERQARAELEAWHARRLFALVGQALSAAGALFGLWCHGLPGLLLGLAVLWIYRQAMPPPSDTLDEYTQRKGR